MDLSSLLESRCTYNLKVGEVGGDRCLNKKKYVCKYYNVIITIDAIS